MRVVLDTNIPVSALMVQMGQPGAADRAWQQGYFTLLTCAEQLDELRATLGKPAIAERIKPYKAGRLVNEMKEQAEDAGALPRVQRSPDPTDDFLLALSEAGKADYLVTGDRGGLLALARHYSTRIVSARVFGWRASAPDRLWQWRTEQLARGRGIRRPATGFRRFSWKGNCD